MMPTSLVHILLLFYTIAPPPPSSPPPLARMTGLLRMSMLILVDGIYHLNQEMYWLTFLPFILHQMHQGVVSFTMESDDALIEHLCRPTEWAQPLPFMMIPEEEMGKENEPELLDLMSISDATHKGSYRYYFPHRYKPSNTRGHQLVSDDLRAAGMAQGVKFSRNGGGPSKGVYPMVCKCSVYYRSATSVTATEEVAGFK